MCGDVTIGAAGVGDLTDRPPTLGVSPAVRSPEQPPMWHVTLTVGGAGRSADDVRAALERLADERPFLLSARFAADRVELRYWEEASCVEDAAALALRLWGEHRDSAGLPPWAVVGLEVVDRATFQLRATERVAVPSPLMPAGGIRPF
jgi:hypothetical protein